MEYVRLCEGEPSRYTLVPRDYNFSKIIGSDKPWYKSIFFYSEEHYARWKEKRTLAGISDVTTHRLVWDFDHKTNIEAARKDANTLCARLIEYGIPQDSIQIAFSGKKGFSIEVETDKRFTVAEFRNINKAMAADLETNDTCILDAQRVFRMVGTKHQDTGCYKFPLTLHQLSDLSAPRIQELAVDLDNAEDMEWLPVELPTRLYNLRLQDASTTAKPAPLQLVDIASIDFSHKPKGFTNCKFAIMNGLFPAGHRSDAMMALASTARAQHFPKEVTYAMCEAAIQLQAERTGTEPFSLNELRSKVINQIYGQNWTGGQYTCKNQPWLKALCDGLGDQRCKHENDHGSLFLMGDMASDFEEYARNIESNTIRTGIEELDAYTRLTIGMPVALLGAPSSGKTSLSLNILHNTSKAGIHSCFFSLDMYGPLVTSKVISKIYGLNAEEVFEIWKHDAHPKLKKREILARIDEEFKNVRFSLKSGPSVQQMRDTINARQEQTGEKIKLVLIDYLECISGPYSDATANTAKIASDLKDFATEMGVCVVTLVQPPKSAGDASSPLTSMRQIKGASMLEQSFRVILGIYREGFGPKWRGYDHSLTIAGLKNTMGETFQIDQAWNGVRGEISPMDDEGRIELKELRRMKEQAAKQGSDLDL